MSLVINNNMMAMNAAGNLNNSYNRLATSTRRLSSGLRVGTAADDAAGLAIRELMRADIASLNQGVRNANDAISMIQVADGAMAVIDEKLIRMKELAEQAATGTYNSTQRLLIDSEYQAMASEITRIANATNFNGIKLLDGNLSSPIHDGSGLVSQGKLKVHFGPGNASAEDYYYIRIQEATSAALGVGNSSDFETTMKRVDTVFENAFNSGFAGLATGSAEDKAAFAQLVAAKNGLIDDVTGKANAVFGDNMSIKDQYAAYSAMFTTPQAGDPNAGDGARVYSSVEELQRVAETYYNAEAALGFANGADHQSTLANVAKLYDNAIIPAKNGNTLPKLTEAEFAAMSSSQREALKTDFAMAAMNTAVNGTNAQQSNPTAVPYYDSMAGPGSGNSNTNNAYTPDQLKSFVKNLDFGYEAGKAMTLAVNSISDKALGNYTQGTDNSRYEFPAGTILSTPGAIRDNVILDFTSTTAPGQPNSIAPGSVLASGSTVANGSILGSGTVIGDGSTLKSTQTLANAGDMTLGAGTVFGAGSVLTATTALPPGTTVTNGTNFTAGSVIGAGTVLGNGTTIQGAALTPGVGTTVGSGSTLASGSVLDAGSVIGAGTNVAGMDLNAGDTLGSGTVVDNALEISDTESILIYDAAGNVKTLTNTTGGAASLATLAAAQVPPVTLGANTKLAGNYVLSEDPSAGQVITAGEGITLGTAQTVGAAGLTLSGTTTLNGASELATGSVLNNTKLGADATIAAGGSIDMANGTTLQGANTSVIGTLGAGSTLGNNLASTAGMVLGTNTVFGGNTTLGADVTMTGNIDTKGHTTLNGNNTEIRAGSTLGAGTELATGSTVPPGTTAINISIYTGTPPDPLNNGVYGSLGFNTATNTIERQGIANFGSFQEAVENVLAESGDVAANTVSMDGNNIQTQENAQKALAALQNAIVIKDNIRADLGALQNRLENTITNLQTQAENLQAAESRISDVDVATEMTQFVRNQILTQSAVAMLTQANSLPKMAMQLIGG